MVYGGEGVEVDGVRRWAFFFWEKRGCVGMEGRGAMRNERFGGF